MAGGAGAGPGGSLDADGVPSLLRRSGLGVSSTVALSLAVGLGLRRSAPDPAGALGPLAILGDSSLRLRREERLGLALGAALDSAQDASGGASGARARDLVERLLGRAPDELDGGSRLALTLGAVLAHVTDGFDDHPLGAQHGAGWAVLGHLFEGEQCLSTGDRAQVLLGLALERAGHDMDPVVGAFGDDTWAMGVDDRALLQLLAVCLRPRRALDAGTFLGGSARALAPWCGVVETIDLDPARGDALADQPNVRPHAGRASDVLAERLDADADAELIVLDADHEADGIEAEVDAVLARPGSVLRAILVHDVAMPSCREGLERIDWESYGCVRSVELDMLPGVDSERGPVGGMALIWTLADDPAVAPAR